MSSGPVVFVFGKWYGFRPGNPPSNHYHNLVGSLASTGLAPAEVFAVDEVTQRSDAGSCDREFYELCHRIRPRLIVVGLSLAAAMFERFLPRVETLVRVRRELGVRIVGVVGDTSRPGFMDLANAYDPAVDLFNVWDNYEIYRDQAIDPDKFWPSWTPQDSRVFHDAGRDRDIDIAFVGALGSGPERADVVEFLRLHGIDVHVLGGQGESYVPLSTVAETYQRARVVLNFAHVEGPIKACRGRVFEATMCGALLLECHNPHTNRWLDPRLEYAPYRSSEELVIAARYFLAHEDLRRRIAERGHRKVTTACTAERYWRQLLGLSDSVRRCGADHELQPA